MFQMDPPHSLTLIHLPRVSVPFTSEQLIFVTNTNQVMQVSVPVAGLLFMLVWNDSFLWSGRTQGDLSNTINLREDWTGRLRRIA
jgi:hypothetical protein